MAKKKLHPLVVTTAHRGVFFGYGLPSDARTITLENARMCVYWPQETHGVLGLANLGPGEGSRITPAVRKIVLLDVTSVMSCTSVSTEAWEAEPWS